VLGKEVRSVTVDDGWYQCATISKNGLMLAAGSSESFVAIYNTTDLKLVAKMLGHTRPVTCVTINQNCTLIVSGSEDGTLIAWDAKTFSQIGKREKERKKEKRKKEREKNVIYVFFF
jgi:WD40 repeat protein